MQTYDDDDGTDAGARGSRSRVPIRASTVISFGGYMIMVLLPIVIGVESCLMIGVPMGPGNVLTKLFYWALVFMIALPTIANIMFSIATSGALKGAAVGAIIFYIISLGWRVFVIIYLALILATCDGDVSCADNLDCAGTITGTYGGPTARYLGLFIMAIITFLAHIAAIFVCFATRWAILRQEPIYMRNRRVRNSSSSSQYGNSYAPMPNADKARYDQ
jgi:hypothetical protein